MFSGSIVALVTPMLPDGAVDWNALEALIEWHIASGTEGIVPMGTTGESATLTVAEHLDVIDRTVKHAAGRVPVIAGTGANNTTEAVDWTKAAERSGADGALLVTPYYNKPPQEGLYRHYVEIARNVDFPILLYNVPSRTACDLEPETIERLAGIDNIVGIKEACGNVERVTAIRDRAGEDFVILSGEDAQTLAMLERGAVGSISVTANVVPERLARFIGAYRSGDVAGAKRMDAELQPLHAMLFIETSPIPVKWALHRMGRIESGIRLPLVPLSEHHRQPLSDALERIGALP